ncbi:hypothetical protein NA57DRAFT_55364 [Rhizodiscina lignyota]|uniref:Uncharacterized protein n=1 Tax=Rhizodiscina lignyota TaxID=1504668 RepID=A0A9P4IHP7_9PEZI|nr:hypothetical protein NA57DRAFT_55364 [Rhizodiscina lignyota]
MAKAKSPHVSEPFLEPFLQTSFDPAAYLNESLPGLSSALSSGANPAVKLNSVSLSELSSQTQNLLSQLNTQTSRLSNILTQMTDDILRSGGRLAYQVEVLRGETLGLSETLTEGLEHDIAKFVPQGLDTGRVDAIGSPSARKSPESTRAKAAIEAKFNGSEDLVTTPSAPYLSQLRTLTQVRARLESVIKIFGEAMQWTIPPSELSLTSSLISVSAPEPGADSQSREEKGREYAEKLRKEIADLVAGTTPNHDGHEAAMTRIQALRDLAQVWKGTSEEKARVKFVENLAKLADDKQRAMQRDSSTNRQRDARSASPAKQPQSSRFNGPEKSYSLLDRLYLD